MSPAVAASEVAVNEQKAIDDLAEMIRCKTVSYYDDEKIDQAEFKKFRSLLKKLYPTVFAKADYEEIGPSGVLFSLKGKSAEQPAVFMAHYDVVPVNEDAGPSPRLTESLKTVFSGDAARWTPSARCWAFSRRRSIC